MKQERTAVLPMLPDGMKYEDRPSDIEFFTRSRGRWAMLLEAVKKLPATKTITIDIVGLSTQQIKAVKSSIRWAKKEYKFDKDLKVAEKSGKLWIWS